MRFAVLGLLQVEDESGHVRPVAGARQRVLLAALLVRANRVVPKLELADIVWDGAPPRGAAALRTQVMRLRQALGPVTGERIAARGSGYMIALGAEELDITLFEALHREAGSAIRAGRWNEAEQALDRALVLWRDDPLLDVESQGLRDECGEYLEQLRVQALEWRAESAMRLGRHEQVVPELHDLVRQYPLREHNHAQLMLALYRSGRQAESLQVYQSARKVLREELGTEPGMALQAMHQRMLTADPSLDLPELAPQGSDDPQSIVPRQLPNSVAHFAGRTAELSALSARLDQEDGQRPEVAVISVIAGTAGVGKTALAVHWAHQVAGRFTDGQLYVDLQGYDPEQPLSAADALAGFLRSLGVPGPDIPPSADQRAARYRSLLADKRMLIVLDNAGSANQVRPLLPGTPASAVVITSRDALAGLVARDGAVRLDLGVLPPKEATALLRALVGPRAEAEPEATAELADRCCRLPLALRIAAELAARRPDSSLSALTGELAQLDTRLDLLNVGGDPHTQMRAVFSWSYRHLDATAAHAFRLIGLHPGPDLEPYAVAALTGITMTQGRRMLDALAGAHLVFPTSPGRHSMYDLLRGYARELAATAEAGQEQRSALTRLFDHYLRTAAAAMDVLFPAECQYRPAVPRAAGPAPALADPSAARDWLDRERAALVAAVRHAAAYGWPGHATRLAATVASYLRDGGHLPEAAAILSCAIDAARRTGDRASEARALNETGLVDWQLGRYKQGADRHRQALTLFRAAGDRAGEAQALGNLGLDEVLMARHEEAACHQQEAAAIYRDTGDQFGEARALGLLGVVRRRQGRYEEAAAYHQQSLVMSRDVGDRHGEAYALGRLGAVDVLLGRPQTGAGYLERSVALLHEIADQGEPEMSIYLGHAYRELGRYEQAARIFEQALARFREIGNLPRQADACNGLGDAALQAGHAGRACAHHAAALRLASEASSPPEQARAHMGLARACQADGNTPQARHHWREALTRYTAIGAAEASKNRFLPAAAEESDDDSGQPTRRDGTITAR